MRKTYETKTFCINQFVNLMSYLIQNTQITYNFICGLIKAKKWLLSHYKTMRDFRRGWLASLQKQIKKDQKVIEIGLPCLFAEVLYIYIESNNVLSEC